MNSYTIYNTNGQILKTITSPAEMLERQVGEGESAVLGAYDDSTHYVDTTGLHVVRPMPAKPDEHHVFDYTTKEWVDPRSLKKLKDMKWEAIKLKRDEAEFGTFEYDGKVLDGDENAQRRLNGYISVSKSALLAGQEFLANFVLADNTVVAFTAQDFVNIEMAKINSVAAAFEKAIQLRSAIYNAGTKAEVEAVSW